jgi:hypothetical protein
MRSPKPRPSRTAARAEMSHCDVSHAGAAFVFNLRPAGVLPNKQASLVREVECPNCKARFLFRRARVPHFDSSGFESYAFKCNFCRASLAGVIDPYDGTLLLSVVGFGHPRNKNLKLCRLRLWSSRSGICLKFLPTRILRKRGVRFKQRQLKTRQLAKPIPVELILIIVILVLLFGGRGGYWGRRRGFW